MDSFIQQVRVKLSNVGQENREETTSSSRRIPLQKTQSFKGENKKAQNWLQRQFSRQMSRGYDSNIQMEHAAAVAAAAYAINSLEESRIPCQKKTTEGPFAFLTRLSSKKEDAPMSVQEITSEGTQRQPSFTRQKSKKDDVDETTRNLEPSLTRLRSKTEDTRVSMTEPGSGSKRFSGGPVDEMPEIAAVEEKTPEKAVSSPPKKKTLSFSDEVLNSSDTTKSKRTPSKVTDPAPSMKSSPTFDDREAQKSTIKSERKARKPDAPPSIKPTTPSAETKRQSSVIPGTDETEADAWEISEMVKIKERYEKLNNTIQSWEEKKKKKARSKLDRAERQLEEKRLKTLTKFRSEMESIDQIAEGARAKAGERRRNEELKAKEKANIIRRTGKAPATCFCC
ncbi:hypothetical protein Pint_23535 [Pistacia integerrima]|uniref:Uncharacterized protein n=1 Tax=Pistacia integerrima TaxID=434235 RepID=A0ACC0YK34_9ROSI|nr:hypothetical protein Pint_23535 [Pistacia integerrima]